MPLTLRGNTKLGKNVAFWSMTAGKVEDGGTCSIVSEACKVCYAQALENRYKATELAYARNKVERMGKDWADSIIKQIKDKKITLVRIHSSGDFDAPWYIEAWNKIIKECPDTRFWAYTRGWKNPELYPHLIKLAEYSNMSLWFSTDHDLGQPPVVPRVRVAYLSLNLRDAPSYSVDLVFRAKKKERVNGTVAVVKRFGPNNDLVCPGETGAERANPVTCDSCTICFNNRCVTKKPNLVQLT